MQKIASSEGTLRSAFKSKTVLVMKLTGILLLACSLSVSATGISQSITYSAENVPLVTFFDEVEHQTGFVFFYNVEQIQKLDPITVNLKNASLKEALGIALEDKPLDFSIEEKTVFISPKKLPPTVFNEILDAPPIKGTVRNTEGQPIVGANVVIKGTQTGYATDVNGQFIIEANAGDILVISSIGFNKKEITVTSTKLPLIVIVLEKSVSQLDQVQFIAYGSTTKRLSTGNVSTVKAEDIQKQPVNNPLLALQGRVPGLYIVQRGGYTNGPVEIQVQGKNSIGSGSKPLFIVDGVPYVNELAYIGSPVGAGNPFSYLNPSDIESIDVLKDADATSIYGSRAANGAIIITTKKGKAGRTSVDINLQQGVAQMTRRYDLLSTEQYIAMREEAKANDNAPILSTDYDINGAWDRNRYTDWQDVFLGGKASYTDAKGSISGGTSNTRFLISGTYHRETSVFPGNFVGQKGAMHFSLNSVSANNKFKVQFSGSYMADDSRNMNDDRTEAARYLAPNAPPLYNEDGTLNWELDENGKNTFSNPMAGLETKYSNKTTNFISNLTLAYQLTRNIEISNSFGFTKINTHQIEKRPGSGFPPNRPDLQRQSRFANSRYSSWITEPQIKYNGKINRGTLEVIVGGTIDQRLSEGMTFAAVDYSSDVVMDDPTAAPTIVGRNFSYSQYKYVGGYGRINYNWDNKYILNLTARRDGSSRFGSENQFNNFASAAGSWIFSDENFMKNNVPFISFGKIKASYGITGNDQITDYSYMALYNTVFSDLGYQNIKGLTPERLANPYLQWEETKKLNMGMSLGFFNDRLLIEGNYYRYRSSNHLLGYSLPGITGFGSIQSNFPATLQNTGIELMLNTTNIQGKDFIWKTSFNISANRNKLIEFPGLATSSYANSYIIGRPINMFRIFDFVGIDPQTGLFSFRNSQGQLISNPNYNTDRTVYVPMDPKFYGGMENSFRFKSLQLDIMLQFVKHVGDVSYQYGMMPGVFYSSSGAYNQPVSVLGRWRKPGDIPTTQYFSTLTNSAAYTAWNAMRGSAYGDASFIRLKNVALSWDLPKIWMEKIKIQSSQLYINAQNLATITNYPGLDPEAKISNSLPPLTVITGGIKLTL